MPIMSTPVRSKDLMIWRSIRTPTAASSTKPRIAWTSAEPTTAADAAVTVLLPDVTFLIT